MSRGKHQGRTSRRDLVDQRNVAVDASRRITVRLTEIIREVERLEKVIRELESDQKEDRQALACLSTFCKISKIDGIIYQQFQHAGAVPKKSDKDFSVDIVRYGAVPNKLLNGWVAGTIGPPEIKIISYCPRCNYSEDKVVPDLESKESSNYGGISRTGYCSELMNPIGQAPYWKPTERRTNLSKPEIMQFDTLTPEAVRRRDKESTCPTGKKQHDSKAAADGFYKLMVMKSGPSPEPLTSYDCNLCGKAHLGRHHDLKKGKLS